MVCMAKQDKPLLVTACLGETHVTQKQLIEAITKKDSLNLYEPVLVTSF